MARQLYRIYLYVVSIALLTFAAVGLYLLLDILFALTPLRGTYRPVPDRNAIVRQAVFAVVSWVVAGLLGGLHYRLIRRDMASDPAAGTSAIRAFLLNLAEAIATLVAVFAAGGAFSNLAYRDPSGTPDSAGPFAGAIAALFVVAVLETERRRALPTSGAGTVFQRLHLYGVPAALIIFAAGSWDSAMRTSVTSLLIRAGIYNPLDPRACRPGPYGPGPIDGPCTLPVAGYLWLAVLVVAVSIALYAILARGDRHSMLRAVLHLGTFAYGLVFVLVGLDRALELALRALLGVSISWRMVAHPWYATHDFVSPLTFGLVVAVGYVLWLRAEARDLPLGAQATRLTIQAISAAILAVPFWWGVGRALYITFEWLAGSRAQDYPAEWAVALGLVITGVGYIPITLDLRRQSQKMDVVAPQRAYVLALLAGGIVTGAVGLAVALYALGTALLGAPFTNWQQTARAGLAALVVGVVLVAVYGWIAVRGRYIEPLMARLAAVGAAPHVAAPTASGERDAIEVVLEQFAAQRITREQAAERLHALIHAPS